MSTGIFGLLVTPPAKPQGPKFHYWQGRSGQWWITTIYPLLAEHTQVPSVYVMVRMGSDGKKQPLYIGQTSNTGRRMDEHMVDKLRAAVSMGGSELHLHFLAKTERERFDIETDLRNGHDTPLNQQGLGRPGASVNLLAQLGGVVPPMGIGYYRS